MKIGVLKETLPGERRVALVPEAVRKLKSMGVEVWVQADAGGAAGFKDALYAQAGAHMVPEASALVSTCDVLLSVQSAGKDPRILDAAPRGTTVVGLLTPHGNEALLKQAKNQGLTTFSMEMMPRITRAQSMDVLSSQSNLAGYEAVLEAAVISPRVFPMMMTAAGTLAPSRVLVLGGGVAGLQAVATARRLGALVRVFDVRPEVKEQVESLGAQFVEVPHTPHTPEPSTSSSPQSQSSTPSPQVYAEEMDDGYKARQRAQMITELEKATIVICTAQIPGKKAPVLIDAEMVARMQPGAVIADLAAETGGNCALTQPGQNIVIEGVYILGLMNVPSHLAHDASKLYAGNVVAFLKLLLKDGALNVDPQDPIIEGTLLTLKGKVVHPRFQEASSSS